VSRASALTEKAKLRKRIIIFFMVYESAEIQDYSSGNVTDAASVRNRVNQVTT
jgi:hypothetical protein